MTTVDPRRGDTVTIPRRRYDRMVATIEDLRDALALKAAEHTPPQNYLPIKEAKRILKGESPVRVWRQHRGRTGADLARAAGISPTYLSEIEAGKKPGSVRALAALAAVLEVSVDDLI